MDRLAATFGCILFPAGALNFSLMNNLGAGHTGGDVLVFLNDDIEPLAAGWLSELASQAIRPEIGIAGARPIYRSGAIQHIGLATGIMGGIGYPHRNTFGSALWPWLAFTRNVSAVTDVLAIRKGVFQELGGFDAYSHCSSAKSTFAFGARTAGYEVIVEPSAVLRHRDFRNRRVSVPPEERALWNQRWRETWVAHGDPYYSPNFRTTCEDPALEWRNRAICRRGYMADVSQVQVRR